MFSTRLWNSFYFPILQLVLFVDYCHYHVEKHSFLILQIISVLFYPLIHRTNNNKLFFKKLYYYYYLKKCAARKIILEIGVCGL